MENVYIHVGLPKTASTYLQEKVLSRDKRVFYVGRPYTQINEAFNSLQYADESCYDPRHIERELEIIRIKAAGRPIIISDEEFSGQIHWGFINRGIVAKRLSLALPNAKIIIFLRDQVDLLESLYNQQVKVGRFSGKLDSAFLWGPGNGMSYDGWINDGGRWGIESVRFNHISGLSPISLDYSKIVDLYSSLFSSVSIFLYEDFVLNKQMTVERLIEMVGGCGVPREEALSRVNLSLDEMGLQRTLIRNRLSMVGFSRCGRTSRVLSRLLCPFLKKQTRNDRFNYIRKLLKESDLLKSNHDLNERYALGMEKFTGKYF